MFKIYYSKEIHNINIPKLYAEISNIGERYNFEQNGSQVILRIEDVDEHKTSVYEQVITPTEIEISPEVLDEEGVVIQEAVSEMQDIVSNGKLIETLITYTKKRVENEVVGQEVIGSEFSHAEPMYQMVLDENGQEISEPVMEIVFDEFGNESLVHKTQDIYIDIYGDVWGNVEYQDDYTIEVLGDDSTKGLLATIDEVILNHDPNKKTAQELRQLRDEAFVEVDRYQLTLVYQGLTDEQKVELSNYRLAWLDVTETMIIPIKPIWMQ